MGFDGLYWGDVFSCTGSDLGLLVVADPMTTIYLAGGKGDWREGVKRHFRNYKSVCLIDPFTLPSQNAIADFTSVDLASVAASDLVLAVNDYPRYTGLALECGYAYALEIPIIYVAKLPRVDSMIAGVSKAIFTDTKEALLFVEERYLV